MKAGQTAGKSGGTSPVITKSSRMPGVQMPGSRTRKVTTERCACGVQDQVAITHGKSAGGKQTWKGAAQGYTTKSAPAFVGAPGPMNMRNSGMGKVQSVKGKDGSRAPRESRSVAGKN